VICNFNDSANVQGTGSTILALHPVVGSTPTFIAQDPSLVGCNALALSPNDVSWAAAYSANDNPLVSAAGRVVTTLLFGPWHGPFGETFSPHKGPFGKAAFYVSNAGDGSIIRVNILSAGGFSYDVIATGFAINGGAPGSILGPSGLQYDAKNDNLYVVDGADNSFTLFKHVSTIPPGGLFSKNGTFGGPFHNRARRIFSGSPLAPAERARRAGEHAQSARIQYHGRDLAVARQGRRNEERRHGRGRRIVRNSSDRKQRRRRTALLQRRQHQHA
jgi:hypothetical protein